MSRAFSMAMLLVGGLFVFALVKRPSERVDVNESQDVETGNNFNVAFSGDPYSVVYFDNVGMYNIGVVTGSQFEPLVGSNGLRYAYADLTQARAKAEQLNNPASGGVIAPAEPEVVADTTPRTESGLPLTDPTGGFDFGNGSPAYGW